MKNLTDNVYDSIAILLANRSFVYLMLQKIYADEPTEELMEIVVGNHAAEALELLLDDDKFNSFENLRAKLAADLESDLDGTISKLVSEYTFLMIGPAELPAPPWESVYITKEPLIFQESTLKVRQAYLKEGFIPAKYPNEADDHIALELDFMYHLANLTLEKFEAKALSETIELLDKQKSFLMNHLLVWIGQFATDMQKSKHQYFYPAMTILTDYILEIDNNVIDEIMSTLGN